MEKKKNEPNDDEVNDALNHLSSYSLTLSSGFGRMNADAAGQLIILFSVNL